MRHPFHTEQWLPYPVEQVFAFFSNPANLPLLMRAWQQARIDSTTIVPPPAPPSPSAHATQAAGSGSRVVLSFRALPLMPFRMKWLAEIVDFKWNERFCDRQISGPFKYWNHCHYIQPQTRDGVHGTLIADDLEYEWSDNVFGILTHRFFLRGQIRRTFAYRQKRVASIFANANQPQK
jgi:ligand-binding SRPBCC domain-containing protein